MASTTILTAILILTWFILAVLILLFTLAFFYFRETYKVEVILTHQPTTPIIYSSPLPLLTYLVVNQISPITAVTLAVINDHPNLLLLTLLGFFLLLSLLSTLALALIIPLLLRLTIRHLEREHQWAFNIATTAQCPLPHTTTNLPVIATNRNGNNLTQVYFEYIREHQD
ncbi:uncharacterized protein FIBRA_08796 [Fibroporia radiculosa]|uniref:Uncharacterized protein n=1 Tax=Fibroporia radiculosa TaxID=599839 RepID=J4GI94_9APHY|nr:uncharacterized protein FIBRA_08796 [Fibroporia radiculosa]CCM06523.1 predicted protein [Fibroporia radiculosa]